VTLEQRQAMALAIAIASISFAAVFFRLASPTHPLVVAGTRLAIAAVVLAIPTARALRAGRLSRRVVIAAMACGALYGVHFGTWVSSLAMTSVASSVTLVTATPLLLAILSFATGRDRPSRWQWIAIALALVGLSLIGWADLSLSRDALLGDGLAFAGAAAMAFYLLIARSLGEDLDVLAFGGLATAFGALSLFAAAWIAGVPIAFASAESLLWIALAALLPQLVGHTLLTWSLRHATPTAVGIATVGEPVGATLLAWIWLGERVTPVIAAGCAITLAAVLLSLRRSA
jgi:drug/metabolite transporter (DMT)-like permease